MIKDLWQNDRKKLILISMGIILGILILIIGIVFILKITKRYSYEEIERLLVTSTEKYVKTHESELPSINNPVTIYASTLVEQKLLKDLSKLSKDTNCLGEVTISLNHDSYRFTPKLECDHYKSTSLYDTILEKEVLQTTQDGLHQLDDFYVYRGDDVNNYISFAGYTWRIFKFDEEMFYLVLKDTVNNRKISYVFDDRYNEESKSNRGKNNFENSRIADSLNQIYENDFKDYHAYMMDMSSCVGSRSEDEDASGISECSKTFTTPFSLLSVYEYMNASLSTECDYASPSCQNYNYLAKTSNRYWLLNGTTENTYDVYSLDGNGKFVLEYATGKKDIRPVLALPTDILYQKGNGTESSPYEFRLF